MVIGLDYDETYTRDPRFWDMVISAAKHREHTVYCVTMRSAAECDEVERDLGDKVDGIFGTNRMAKEKYMFQQGYLVDVWIDDTPYFITNHAYPAKAFLGGGE